MPLTLADVAKVPLDVTVVGAGLGGLACAIAFQRRGHRVTIFESAPQIAEIGAGIQGELGGRICAWNSSWLTCPSSQSEHVQAAQSMGYRRDAGAGGLRTQLDRRPEVE